MGAAIAAVIVVLLMGNEPTDSAGDAHESRREGPDADPAAVADAALTGRARPPTEEPAPDPNRPLPELDKVPKLPFRGRVEDHSERGVSGVTLKLEGTTRSWRGRVTTQSDGSFRIDDVPEGAYPILIRPIGDGAHYLRRVVAADELPVLLSPHRGKVITGVVILPDGSPALGARVSVHVNIRTDLMSAFERERLRNRKDIDVDKEIGVEVGSDGTFRLDVPHRPATHRLTITPPTDDYTVLESRSVRPGEILTPIRLYGRSTFSGRVVDTAGKPVPGTTVACQPGENQVVVYGNERTPQSAFMAVTRTVKTDEDGRFSVRGADIRSTLLAEQSVKTREARDDPAFRFAEPGATKIELVTTGHRLVRGRIVGAPIGIRATLTLVHASRRHRVALRQGNRPTRRVSLDRYGRFHFLVPDDPLSYLLYYDGSEPAGGMAAVGSRKDVDDIIVDATLGRRVRIVLPEEKRDAGVRITAADVSFVPHTIKARVTEEDGEWFLEAIPNAPRAEVVIHYTGPDGRRLPGTGWFPKAILHRGETVLTLR